MDRNVVYVVFVSSLFLCGCASTLEIRPVLPDPKFTNQSEKRLGIYIPPRTLTEEVKTKLGTGIWPGTRYTFSPGPVVRDALTTLTKRHFKNTEFAENALDKNWDWIVEYYPYQPGVNQGSFQANVPLGFTIRDTRTAKEIQETVTLYGTSPKQPGRFWRLFGGTWVEKRHLERTLNIAYTNLFDRVDTALSRNVAKEEESRTSTPYRRGRRETMGEMRSRSRTRR